MPVSPQDFALWSRMTGNPMPRTPAEQMRLAPQVFQFNQQLAQGRNPLQSAAESISSTIDKVGKAALGLGVVAGAGLLAGKGLQNLSNRTAAEGAKVEEPAETVADIPSSSDTQAAKLLPPGKPSIYELMREGATPSPSKEFLSSAISRYSRPEETPDIEVVRVEEMPASKAAPTLGGEPEDVVKVTQIEMPSKGVSSEDIVQAVQTAKSRTAAERRASRLADAPDFGDTREILPKDLDLYAQHTQAMHRSGVSERAQQFLNRLGLDDEVAVDNDIIAANPGSNTALASQDVTSADPASTIGQRISSNQTGAAVAARSAAVPKQTVASKLSQQQSVVHLDEADNELVGAPAPGAVEALKKGRQYQEMKQRYEGLQDIASPGTEGVSSTDVLPTVQRSTPVPTSQPAPRGASPAEVAEYDANLARGMSTTPQAERIAIRNRHFEKKYGAAPAVVTEEVQVAKPAGVAPVAFLKGKASTVMPQATQRGTVEHAVAEAMEQREGMRQPPEGTQVFELPKGGTRQVKLYPSQQVGVVYANDPHTEYSYKSSPEYYGELEGMLKRGEFVPGGTGFIQAGRNLGQLY